MKLNLRNRILLPTLALLIAVTAVLSVVSFFMSRRALDDSYDALLTDVCNSGLQQIESWVDGQRSNVVHWAAQPHVLAALQDGAEASVARTVLSAQFMDAATVYNCFQNLQLVDLKGNTVCSNVPASIGTLNVADRSYFKEAATGKVTISEVLKSRTTGNPIVVVATPVKNGTEIRGVLFVSLDLNWFSANLLGKIKVLNSGYAYLYDEKGVFISHPKKELIMTAKLADYDWSGPMLNSPSGRVRYTFQGVEKIVRFKNSPALHWGLVVTAPISEILAPVYRMRSVNMYLGLGSVALGALVTFLIARSISRPIQQIAVHLDACSAEGISASGQVSNASQSLAQGASVQASSLEETSASLEEMSSMTQRNAESSTKANELARAARRAADGGSGDMEAMGRAMSDIKTSSDDIAKIIKTIDEIAFQTNILALNAAVEAARAGEAGAGFAVVAEEVRSLAQRSADAAKETAAKIEGAIVKTTQGVEISGKVAKSLSEIVDKVRQVDELVTEVATASREQNQGVQQINAAISQMDKVVQSNAAGAEESAAAAEQLNAQALSLNEIISNLRELVDGRATSTQSSTADQIRQTVSEPRAPLAPGKPAQRRSPAAAASRTSDRDDAFFTSDTSQP